MIAAGRPTMRHRLLAFLETMSPFADDAAEADVRGDWRWLFADDAGVAVAGPPVRFTSALGAEQWLRSNASRLRLGRITGMTLLDGEHVVYGPAALVG